VTIRTSKQSRARKQKGRQFESDVVEYLRSYGFPAAERRRQRGAKDAGDIAGVLGVVWECKNHKDHDLAGFVDEAEREAGSEIGIVVLKRRGKPASDAYAIVSLRTMAAILRSFVPRTP
jgi:hypothetical protein